MCCLCAKTYLVTWIRTTCDHLYHDVFCRANPILNGFISTTLSPIHHSPLQLPSSNQLNDMVNLKHKFLHGEPDKALMLMLRRCFSLSFVLLVIVELSAAPVRPLFQTLRSHRKIRLLIYEPVVFH